jgi:hypothetical protein
MSVLLAFAAAQLHNNTMNQQILEADPDPSLYSQYIIGRHQPIQVTTKQTKQTTKTTNHTTNQIHRSTFNDDWESKVENKHPNYLYKSNIFVLLCFVSRLVGLIKAQFHTPLLNLKMNVYHLQFF